jgi:putative NADPH-quinone reductase
MAKQIFIWVGHPKSGSLCEGIADAYQVGAESAGAEIRRINLGNMSFDMDDFTGYSGTMPPLEPDLTAWQEAITWADHLLFVHPYWWGAMPAKAKAVLDRALTPGFGFKYHDKGMGWDKLLTGKTADVIITSDTPPLIDTLLYRKPGRRVIKNQVLGFCGIKTRKNIQFGTIKTADKKKISGWLEKAGKLGVGAAD